MLDSNIIGAIYSGDISTIRNWQNLDNINDADTDKRSAVFHAVIAGAAEILVQLLKDKPDLNIKDKRGWYPLHYAAQEYFVDIAKILIDSGANLEVKDDYGNTPLWRATFSSNGRGEMIKSLLLRGANRNNENDSGITPVKLASTIANYNVKQFYDHKL